MPTLTMQGDMTLKGCNSNFKMQGDTTKPLKMLGDTYHEDFIREKQNYLDFKDNKESTFQRCQETFSQ